MENKDFFRWTAYIHMCICMPVVGLRVTVTGTVWALPFHSCVEHGSLVDPPQQAGRGASQPEWGTCRVQASARLTPLALSTHTLHPLLTSLRVYTSGGAAQHPVLAYVTLSSPKCSNQNLPVVGDGRVLNSGSLGHCLGRDQLHIQPWMWVEYNIDESMYWWC